MFHRRAFAVLAVVLAAVLGVGFANPAVAATTDVTWNNADGTLVGSGAGSNSQSISMAVPNVSAASILLATTTSGVLPSGHVGIFDNIAFPGTVTFSMEIELLGAPGVWVPVWSTVLTALPAGGLRTVPLSGLGPIPFGTGLVTVTGLQLSSTALPTALGGWGGLRDSNVPLPPPLGPSTNPNGDTIFRFDTDPNPEPATLLLVGAGIGGLALGRRRKRKLAEA